MHQPTILSRLFETIEQRKQNPPQRSYTTKLFSSGHGGIADKIREEAEETIEAATETGPEGQAHLVHEAADLIYHLFVMLAYRDVTLADVEAELARRFGTSGLVEKAARKSE